MVLEWLKRQFVPASRPAPRRARPRLELEQLETRMVPAAIRMLPGFTTNTLAANDDGSTPAVNIGFNINFFGVNTNQVFVNNNGNITLNNALAAYIPFGLTTPQAQPIIAPFLADVDTRGVGSGLVTYGNDTLCGEQAFGVDWINVGYFNSHVDKLNSFQLILVSRPDAGPGDFDIEFNYNQILWESGDASGGTNGLGGPTTAAVGYSNGSGTPGTFDQLPGSLMAGSFINGGPDALISNDILASTPGRYHFLVRNGQVIVAPPPTTAGNNDVSSLTRFLDPFRWITDDVTTGAQHGNLTLVNTGGAATTPTPNNNAINACLDITQSTTPTSTTSTASTFPGPITVVFENLPSNVTIINPTGFTASGKAYITENVSGLPLDTPVLRVAVEIDNAFTPAPNSPSTFFGGGLQVETFAGSFDPTAL